jgi:hypothetical protein
MNTTTKAGFRVVTQVRVAEPVQAPYRVKTTAVVWFFITLVSLATIYAL